MIFNKKPDEAKNTKQGRGGTDEVGAKNLIEDLKKCQDDSAKIAKERDDYLAGWQRERADFANYKKEQIKVFEDIKKFAAENFIMRILPVLDNLEAAASHLPRDFKDNDWAKGVIQIKEQIKTILKDCGVEEIKTEGEKFNPEFHEAAERVESEGEEEMIIEEIQKGYLMHGKVIRPARVKVAAKPTVNNKQ